MHRLRIEPIFCEHCNVLVAENLHVRLRPRITKRFERRQSENEIADCAAADHQNAVHLSCVATALWAVFMMKSNSPGRYRRIRAGGYRDPLILRKREPENHAAVNQRDRMQTAPAKNTARAPINLIAKDVPIATQNKPAIISK